MKRFQMDPQWQRDFGKAVDVLAVCLAHVKSGREHHKAGRRDEARAELKRTEEGMERLELIEHSLRDL